MKVYFDNAATTPLAEEVFETMAPFLKNAYGNPSSTHSHGRMVKAEIEKARKKVAGFINAEPGEITFTSGGTEADNMAIKCHISKQGLTHAITAKTEHKAVLQPLKNLADQDKIELSFVDTDQFGRANYDHLESLLEAKGRSMVALMHANNEIGTLNDLDRIAELCKMNESVFHSDTVQTLGHLPIDVKKTHLHSLAGSAHKLHGPKGAGIMYCRKSHRFSPWIEGGGQERNMRGGTENVYGIIGFAKALEIAVGNMENERQHIQGLKDNCRKQLIERVPGVEFNGDQAAAGSLQTVLNFSVPPSSQSEMLLFQMDMKNISVSGGSACNSGAQGGSHVINCLDVAPGRGIVRFSFSRMNVVEEVDFAVNQLCDILGV